MTFSFIARLLFVSLIRFVGLMALILWYQNFEVSPLPAWTLDATLLLAQFGWTFLCVRWVFLHVYPTKHLMIALVAVFLLGQVILELWLTRRLTGGTWWLTIRGAVHWGALLQISLHLGAIYLGYWRTKKHVLMEHELEEAHITDAN